MKEEMKNDDEERNFILAKLFLKEKKIVHVQKKDGFFYNGYIIEISPDFFFMVDRELGKQLVFFRELIKPISEFKFRGVGDGK
jgi:hypothetical protein|tara:strand:+ start:328 stop:576 length:249 start_codon:yes stop_codon:yes gene_type:complete